MVITTRNRCVPLLLNSTYRGYDALFAVIISFRPYLNFLTITWLRNLSSFSAPAVSIYAPIAFINILILLFAHAFRGMDIIPELSL